MRPAPKKGRRPARRRNEAVSAPRRSPFAWLRSYPWWSAEEVALFARLPAEVCAALQKVQKTCPGEYRVLVGFLAGLGKEYRVLVGFLSDFETVLDNEKASRNGAAAQAKGERREERDEWLRDALAAVGRGSDEARARRAEVWLREHEQMTGEDFNELFPSRGNGDDGRPLPRVTREAVARVEGRRK